MENLLCYQYSVKQDDYQNAGTVSSQIKKILLELQIDIQKLRKIAIACYEGEINMIIHSYGGQITMTLSDEGRLTLLFQDLGPGISNIDQAMEPGYSTASEKAREFGFGAGMGLPNMKKNSDQFQIQSSSSGTTIQMEFFV